MRLRTLYLWHLASSLCFALGTSIPVATYTFYAFWYDDEDPQKFIIAEWLGWTLLTAHVLPEIVIDLNTFPGRTRRIGHIRYGATPWNNLFQSLIFAAASFFQGSYYVHEWYEEAQDEEEDEAFALLNMIAGHFWLLSGILTAFSLGFGCLGCCSSSRLGIWEQFVNDIYILTTFVLLFISYFIAFAGDLVEELEYDVDYILHATIRCLWASIGVFYFISDVITFRDYSPTSELDNPHAAQERTVHDRVNALVSPLEARHSDYAVFT